MTDPDNKPIPNKKTVIGVLVATLALTTSLIVGRSSCGPTPPTPTPTPGDAAAPPPPIDAAPPACDFVGPRATRLSMPLLPPPRIVGGTPASEGQYPYAVALATSSRFQYCGGTLIARRIVLTAAHCQVSVGDLALVGSNDLNQARAVKIVESRINRAFDPATLDYDVAIAVLAEDVDLSAAGLAADPIPATATVIGWGAMQEGGSTTTLLRQVDVPIWISDDCRRVYPELTSRQICAGRVSGGADSCQGDSGGALLVLANGVLHQLGIVSYGIGCARPGIPGVYTDLRAPEIRAWIDACSR